MCVIYFLHFFISESYDIIECIRRAMEVPRDLAGYHRPLENIFWSQRTYSNYCIAEITFQIYNLGKLIRKKTQRSINCVHTVRENNQVCGLGFVEVICDLLGLSVIWRLLILPILTHWRRDKMAVPKAPINNIQASV